MAMRTCRNCGGQHGSADEARRCWTQYDRSEAHARRAEQRRRDREEDELWDDDHATRKARASVEVGTPSVAYRSAESQALSEANRFIAGTVRDGGSMADDARREALVDLYDNVLATVDDSETLTDESWAIADDRVRSSEQAMFSRREFEEVPEVSDFDVSNAESYFWHEDGCGCYSCCDGGNAPRTVID